MKNAGWWTPDQCAQAIEQREAIMAAAGGQVVFHEDLIDYAFVRELFSGMDLQIDRPAFEAVASVKIAR